MRSSYLCLGGPDSDVPRVIEAKTMSVPRTEPRLSIPTTTKCNKLPPTPYKSMVLCITDGMSIHFSISEVAISVTRDYVRAV